MPAVAGAVTALVAIVAVVILEALDAVRSGRGKVQDDSRPPVIPK